MKNEDKNILALINGGEKSFSFNVRKLEKIAASSVYYAIYGDSFFYLFNTSKTNFALKSNSIDNAHKFWKIEDYSEQTQSFVAYRYDKPFVHILYEDGYVEEKTFKYVGKEIDGIRPVQTGNNRWFFYNSSKRCLLDLTGKNGYSLNKGYFLDRVLFDDVFTIKTDRGFTLVFKIPKQMPHFFHDCFDEFYDSPKGTIIGKLTGREIYCIIKFRHSVEVVGYYNNRPIYKNKLYIALKGNSWCVIKGQQEIQNYQWKSDVFLFCHEYIFNKSNHTAPWKIYNAKDGQEVPNNWKNIRIYDSPTQDQYILVDGDDYVDKKIRISDIKEESSLFIKSILPPITNNKYVAVKEKQIEKNFIGDISVSATNEERVDTIANPKVNEDIVELSQSRKHAVSTRKEEIPTQLDFFVIVNSVKINNGVIQRHINCQEIKGKAYVVWVILNKRVLHITESRTYGTHRVLYTIEENIDELLKCPYAPYLHPLNIENVPKLIKDKKLSLILLEKIKEVAERICNGENKIKHNTSNIPKNDTENDAVIPILQNVNSSEILENEDGTNIDSDRTGGKDIDDELIINEDLSTFKLNDPLSNGKILFSDKRYIKVKQGILVLLNDDEDKVFNSQGFLYYYIKGEDISNGQDLPNGLNYMFSRAMEDRTNIFLFRRNASDKIVFQDMVICYNFSDLEKDNNRRKNRIFKMLSIGNSEARDRGKQDVTNFKSESYDSSILDKSQTKHEVIDGKDNISKDELVRLKESIIHDIMTTIKRIDGTQLFVDLKYDTTGCLYYSFGTNSSNIMIKGEVNLSDCIASSSTTQISSNKFSAREESWRCIRIKNLSNNSFILYGNVSGYEDFLMKHDGKLSRFSPESEGWIFPINKESKIRDFFSIPFENKTLTLKDYIYYFNSLNVSTRLGNVSPHKAIMLLSVMDLVAKNKITSNRIDFSLDLENSFKQNWKTYVPKDSCFRANAYIPYGYMKSEPFWRLVSKKDGESVIDKINKVITCSPSTIEKYKLYAEIDDDLFKLMNDTESRNRLRETLIQKYLHISSSKQKP